MIAEGTAAPDFEAETDDGRPVKLSELRGKPVVLYFYPKDDTPGCTAQACGIRDSYGEFRSRGVEIFGVSADDADSHREFRDKYQLPFPLLVDDSHALAAAFGVETSDRGFYKRSTVVIDAEGHVAKVLENVDPATHVDDVLSILS
jgi:thioredoxin-dependent peroxiredoxin